MHVGPHSPLLRASIPVSEPSEDRLQNSEQQDGIAREEHPLPRRACDLRHQQPLLRVVRSQVGIVVRAGEV